MELRGRFCSDESLLHRRDFDWLYEAVSKVICVVYLCVHCCDCVGRECTFSFLL